MSGPQLAVSGLKVSYGGILAVSNFDLELAPGEMVGLIGPNGAGKTTTVDAITGFVDHGGMVQVGGIDVSSRAPHDRVRAGVARTWQSVELFDDLTVRQQCLVAADSLSLGDLVADMLRPKRGTSVGNSDEALELLGLTHLADRKPSELPHGTQKLVGVARALASAPSVLLLDEPAAGLDAEESAEFGDHLRTIASEGVAILLIDHDTQLVLSTCDRVAVLDFGSTIAQGTPDEIRQNDAVIQAYLGVGGGLVGKE